MEESLARDREKGTSLRGRGERIIKSPSPRSPRNKGN